jgi:TatD DNase family protein
MQFIDTHVHLYSKEFRNDIEAVIQKAQQNGVSHLLMPNVDKESIAPMLQLAKDYSDICKPMMGLHPCYVDAEYKSQLDTMREELEMGEYIAVGEIGLDLYWDKTFFEQQRDAFRVQTEWAMEKGLPIAIHTRNATPEAIEVLRPLVSDKLRGVFHCFVGTADEAKEMVEMGFYLGIGGVCTFKNSDLGNVLPQVPLDKVLLETDAPYLAPIPFRGKRNESSYLTHIAKRLAEIYGVSIEEIARVTTENAKRLFGIYNPLQKV